MSAPIQSHGSPIVSPSELIRLIVHCYKRRIPLMIWGIPGIGKSSCFRQAGRILAEELGKKYGEYPWMQPSEDHFLIHDLRMTLRNPVDIRGTPWPNRVKEVTEWLPTEELPKTGYGIILFDDIPTAEPSCQKAAFRLFLHVEFSAFLKLALDYDWESLLKEPNTFPLPTSIDQLYALSGILMEKVNDEQLLRPTLIILKRIFGTAPEFGALVGKYIVERYSTKLLEYPEWKPIQKWGKFLL